MTPKKLIKELCLREKLKKQVSIAQMTETVGHLSDIICEMDGEEMETFIISMCKLGEKRAKKAAKK